MKVKKDIEFLLDKKLISSKKMGDIILYHITSSGVESLKTIILNYDSISQEI